MHPKTFVLIIVWWTALTGMASAQDVNVYPSGTIPPRLAEANMRNCFLIHQGERDARHVATVTCLDQTADFYRACVPHNPEPICTRMIVALAVSIVGAK